MMARTTSPIMQHGPLFLQSHPVPAGSPMAMTHHHRWYGAEGPASEEEWWHHSEMVMSNFSFKDETLIFPVLVFSVKKKNKSHFHQKAIVLKKKTKPTP